MRKRTWYIMTIVVAALMLMGGTVFGVWVTPQITFAAPQSSALANRSIVQDTTAQLDVVGILPTQEVLSSLYDAVSPSVVNIQVSTNPQTGSGSVIPGLPFGDPVLPAPQQRGQGSGFIYDMEGHIITNNHVVEDATEITVYFANGMWADATLVARDPQADLAVINVDPPAGVEWLPLELAPDGSLRVGFYVAALGSPFGLNETMTVGVVSALSRSFPTGDPAEGGNYSLPDVIQTDTAINPGNSGGPLLNLKGEVVGVNFAINSPVRANSGVGFAIPISIVHRVVPALIEDGAYRYSYLGIAGSTISDQVAEENGLADNTLGVFVGTVIDGGPAALAGIRENDVIVSIDDRPVHKFEDLIGHLLQATTPGQSVEITLLRGDKQETVSVTLQERPSAAQDGSSTREATRIALPEAIKVAKDAVVGADLMTSIESASGEADVRDGLPVWTVTLSGNGKIAEVVVDATSGDVLSLSMK